jgi:nucleoside-diphosphate-sugar epimerase
VNVLEFCRRRAASLTFISSYAYGRPRRLPIAEDHPLQALNPYSHSKILAERIVRFYGARFGVSAVIVRPFNVYGPGQKEPFLVPSLIRQALDPKCERITVADLRPRRDYLHVRDLVSLMISSMAAPRGDVFNAGSGHSLSVGDMIAKIAALTGVRKPVHSAEEIRPGEVLNVVADISKAERELAWRPQISIDQGLCETIAWTRSAVMASQ